MSAGIYIHIPFCVSKCAYCDFYSLPNMSLMEEYGKKILSEINRWGSELSCPADTLYFGGGTPSLMDAGIIADIINKCREAFSLKDAEITLEANPKENLEEYFKILAAAGLNRISLGLQSANENELKALGRRHSPEDVIKAVSGAKNAGIDNISLDIMLGIPNQTEASLDATLDFALNLEPAHISAYMLSLEEGTPLYKNRDSLDIPSEDMTADLYLATADKLRANGFDRYEISNFARDDKISRHNSKYWTGEDYLGFGPSAHSLIKGKRFYYDRSLEAYLKKPTEIYCDEGGGLEEKIMLGLRLSLGLSLNKLKLDFGNELTEDSLREIVKKARLLKNAGLVSFDGDVISLTDKGAVISNSIITEFLLCL